jgi:hypothetical protein
MSRLDGAAAVVQEAERTVYRAKLQILQERALAALAAVPGLRYVRLYPPSPVIYVVAYNGSLLGRVRLEQANDPDARWLAVTDRAARALGRYPDVEAAARALAGATIGGVPCSPRISPRPAPRRTWPRPFTAPRPPMAGPGGRA